MKLAPAGPAAKNQERRDLLRRNRAAAPALRVAYPAVQQLHLDLTFQGTAANTPAPQSNVLHPPAQAFFEFPCPYSDCDGQFNLAAAVKAAVANPEHRAEAVLECQGKRAVLLAGVRQPCQLHLTCKITATYKTGN